MDILKSFEEFLSTPISIIKKRNIKIMHVETNVFVPKLPIGMEMNNDIELTIYNNPKVYRLLSTVIYKRKLNNANKDSNIRNKCTIS